MMNMPEIIYRSNKGIIFEKTVQKNGKCKLVVRNEEGGRAHMKYLYWNVLGVDSPYLNWDNLNCCNGWAYDETYLYTAVQRSRKPFAQIVFSSYDADWLKQIRREDLPTENDTDKIIKKLIKELPDDCILNEEPIERRDNFSRRCVNICKNGTIIDYINLDDVYAAYERLGFEITDKIKDKIGQVCSIPMELFAADDFPFDYGNPQCASQLIITGLLLGYPVETTAFLLERDWGTVVDR